MVKTLSLLFLAATTLAQFENFGGFEGYYHKPVSHQHQSLDENHGEQQGEEHGEHHSEHHSQEYELDYHAHPKYSFDYSVKDPHTGDDKEHWETRDGDKVKGTYTLVETDGTKRVVEYEADDKNGFNAVVHKIGKPKHEEYHAKPAQESAEYQHDFGQFDEGFVPVSGGFEH